MGEKREVGSIPEQIGMTGYDRKKYQEIKAGWDSVAKPLDSLGQFEGLHARIGAIQGKNPPDLMNARLIVCCADNGVVEEGVSQSGQEVTAICAESIANGKSSVAIMAGQVGVEVLTVDVGIHTDRELPNVRRLKVRNGTRNFAKEPAMSPEEAQSAIKAGITLAKESAEEGVRVLCIGEMGIGNTTTSSTMTAAFLRKTAAEVTGRGAGISDEGLCRKREVIQNALDHYGLYEKSPLEVLCCVGGFDIACMAGICIGAGRNHIPVILDGFISLVAALTACRMVPEVREYLIPSHGSREPAARALQEELGLRPILQADMALGEGTGAVLMLQLLRTVGTVYERGASFEKVGIMPYARFDI